MKTNNLVLLSDTSYGNAQGNYDGSSIDFTGDAQKAAAYYSSTGSLQTVSFNITNFVGEIVIEATLDSTPTEDSWFAVYNYSDLSSAMTETAYANIQGRFTWIRAKVTNFEQGTIGHVLLAY